MQHLVGVVMVMIGLHFSLASSLWAFAVGDIAVHSRRGEPFAAEIHLLLESRERDKEVEVTLGNQAAYQAEGFKRPAAINALKAVLFPDTRDVIRLSSAVPLRKSAFDLVLLVRAGQITIVKHYHIALPAPAPASAHVMAPLPTIAQVAPVAEAPQTTVKPTRFAVAAAGLGLRDSGLDTDHENPERVGVVMGTGLVPVDLEELAPTLLEACDDEGKLDRKSVV